MRPALDLSHGGATAAETTTAGASTTTAGQEGEEGRGDVGEQGEKEEGGGGLSLTAALLASAWECAAGDQVVVDILLDKWLVMLCRKRTWRITQEDKTYDVAAAVDTEIGGQGNGPAEEDEDVDEIED